MTATTVTIGNATLQAAGAVTIPDHPISLTGSATIDTQTNAVSISSMISGSGSLTSMGTGAGTLTLSGANNYTGGTTILSGTLTVSNDGNLGAASGPLT